MRTNVVSSVVSLAVCAISLGACVKGNPEPVGTGSGSGSQMDTFMPTGGSLAISDCGYTVTSYQGAEAPKLADNTFGADPTVRLVHLSIVGDPKTSMVAQWRTMDETTHATTIRFAESPDGMDLAASALTQTRTGIEFGYRGTGATVYRVHQAHLCGLKPATYYSYQVGASENGVDHFSPVYTFRTAPDVAVDPTAMVQLAFVGDSRGGYDVWQNLIGVIQGKKPDLILFSGDAVTIGITQFEWEDFFGRAEPLFARVPVISANGNHEDNAVNYYSQIALPGDQQNFGIDYGFAHITVGNDTPVDATALTGSFHDALATDFEASKAARWKLFMHHQPMFSSSSGHGSNTMLRDAWFPLVAQYQLDLVLNGHDHDYEITKPLDANQMPTAAANGTVFVVAGGAGAELYGKGSLDFTQFSESNYTMAMISVSHGSLSLTPFHQDGSALDASASFMKTKN